MTRPAITACLLLACTLAGGEPLICRGFPVSTALAAVTGASSRVTSLAPDLAGERDRRVWFMLADTQPRSTGQVLAHALGCWWYDATLTRARRVPAGSLSVRAYAPLPQHMPGSEALLSQLLDPWLGGDGALALDTLTGGWSATTTPAGHAHLETLLSALADPGPRAPHLLPTSTIALNQPLSSPPAGNDLFAWSLALARGLGCNLSLSPDVDPQGAAPTLPARTAGEALQHLANAGHVAAYIQDTLCIGGTLVRDRQHPAARTAVAVLPVGHLSRDPADLAQLVAALKLRVAPWAWTQPGWDLVVVPGRQALLVVADGETIHAGMSALEAADLAGLTSWLH